MIGEMLRSARESTADDTDSESSAVLDMADQQFSQLLANNGGLGLASMVVKGLNQGEQNAHSHNPLDTASLISQTGAASQTGKANGRSLVGDSSSSIGDNVQLSDYAKMAAGDPDKISRLTAAVSSGQYQVSPAQIANSLIADAFGD